MSENALFPVVEVPELIEESERYDEKYKPRIWKKEILSELVQISWWHVTEEKHTGCGA